MLRIGHDFLLEPGFAFRRIGLSTCGGAICIVPVPALANAPDDGACLNVRDRPIGAGHDVFFGNMTPRRRDSAGPAPWSTNAEPLERLDVMACRVVGKAAENHAPQRLRR